MNPFVILAWLFLAMFVAGFIGLCRFISRKSNLNWDEEDDRG